MRSWKHLVRHPLRLALLAAPGALLGCIPPAGLEEMTEAPVVTNKDGNLQVNSVNPTIGTTDGDRIALVRGSGFVPGMTVMFGDEEAKEVTFVSDTMVTALVPAHQAGPVDVTLQAEVNGTPRTVALQDSFTFVMPPDDDGTDTDGDGLTDVQEQIVGWRIRIDMLGLGMNPAHLTKYNVNSDPLNPDTDGDGLLDNEEFFANTNPRSRDTDTDGLWDGEEAKRWLTSPISVDSDGDARASDPSTDRSTIPPVFDLFDGLELYTAQQLTLPPDQRGPIKLNATSPTLDDTDGDNETDFEEFDTPVRNPQLADMPQLRFEIVDKVDVRLDVEYAEELGTTTAFETSFETGTSSTESASQSNTVSSSVTVGAQLSLFPFEGLGLSAEVTAGREESWETTQESTVEASQTLSELQERSRVNTETAASGSITAGVRITNLGNITVQVIDLVHTVRQWLPNDTTDGSDSSNGSYNTIAALAPDLGPGLTLSPGADSGVLLAIDEDINPDRIRDLLARPESLQLQSAAYELVNDEGFNFAFIDEVTQARTARVSVDFGDGNFEEYRVATNIDRNADGSLAGLPLSRALDLTVGVGNWASETIINPCGPQPQNLIQNSSFESPDLEFASPADWTSRNIGGPGSGVPFFAVASAIGPIPPAPVGDQWLVARIDRPFGGSRDFTGLSQSLGFATSSTAIYEYSYQTTPASWEEYESDYSIALYAGQPGSGGRLLDFENYTTGTANFNELVTISGLLSGAVSPGEEIFIEISVGTNFEYADQSEMFILFDDFQVLASDAPSSEMIDVISRVRDTSYDLEVPRFWSVFVDGQPLADGADFSNVTLSAGDAVLIAYQQDNDGDGLYASQEQQYGSSDAAADTDGDGLNDSEEASRQYAVGLCAQANGGWNVTVTKRDGSSTTTRVYSDPARTDADQDNLDDAAERAAGTNPNSADTDGDGLNDDVDPDPRVQATIYHVREDGPNTGGTSWATAFNTMQAAINAAVAVNSDGNAANDVSEIWVANGEYTLTNQGLPNNIAIYGGFGGNETRLAQRIGDALTNGTFITSTGNNPMLLLDQPNVNARLDGFLLLGSTNRAIDASLPATTNITIANCLILDNTANNTATLFGATGGAVRAAGFGTLTIEDCIFDSNAIRTTTAVLAHGRGGALFSTLENLIVRRTSFDNNRVDNGIAYDFDSTLYFDAYGGAVTIENGKAVFEDCSFRSNTVFNALYQPGEAQIYLFETVELKGGAIAVRFSGEADLQRCTFDGNSVDDASEPVDAAFTERLAGGAISVQNAAKANLVNCVLTRNRAPVFGGGLYVDPASDARVVNCTFVDNQSIPGSDPNLTGGRTNTLTSLTPLAIGAAIGSSGDTYVANTAFWNNTGIADVGTGRCCIPESPAYLGTWGIEEQVATRPQIFFVSNPISTAAGTLNLDHSAALSFQTERMAAFGGSDDLFANLGISTSNVSVMDPGFVDLDNGNLQLADNSPLIDAGQNVVDTDLLQPGFQLLPAGDLKAANRRVDGNGDGKQRVDIGAYEYQPN